MLHHKVTAIADDPTFDVSAGEQNDVHVGRTTPGLAAIALANGEYMLFLRHLVLTGTQKITALGVAFIVGQ